MRLFAAQGFRGTTVGEIEAAAGLAPRAGGLYKHFRSKEEVLEAGIDRHLAETALSLGIAEAAAAKRYIRALKRLKALLATMPGGLDSV